MVLSSALGRAIFRGAFGPPQNCPPSVISCSVIVRSSSLRSSEIFFVLRYPGDWGMQSLRSLKWEYALGWEYANGQKSRFYRFSCVALVRHNKSGFARFVMSPLGYCNPQVHIGLRPICTCSHGGIRTQQISGAVTVGRWGIKPFGLGAPTTAVLSYSTDLHLGHHPSIGANLLNNFSFPPPGG